MQFAILISYLDVYVFEAGPRHPPSCRCSLEGHSFESESHCGARELIFDQDSPAEL